jgi:hypothetical protein
MKQTTTAARGGFRATRDMHKERYGRKNDEMEKEQTMRMRTTLAFAALLPLAAAACSADVTAPSQTAAVAGQGSPGATSARGGRPATTGVIFVTSQGLYYDTFVAKDPLPMAGEFQLLANGTTELGPGDAGYLGGRWWEDLNQNGVQDTGDHFFLCPLLPPGRSTP